MVSQVATRCGGVGGGNAIAAKKESEILVGENREASRWWGIFAMWAEGDGLVGKSVGLLGPCVQAN